MRIQRVNVTSRTSKKYLYLARKFTTGGAASPQPRTVRYRVYDGVLFRTSVTPREAVTDILVLPGVAYAVNITSRDTDEFRPGRAAHVRNVDIAKISRDVFVRDVATEGNAGFDTLDVRPASIPEPFAFGDPMPEGTPSFTYTAFTGKQADGYATTRSTQSFDRLFRGFVDPLPDYTAAQFWAEVVVCLGGDRFRQLTFSEAWLAEQAPGHLLVSRSHRLRVTANFIAACSNGRNVAVTIPMHRGGSGTQNWGACNALTLYINLRGVVDTPAGPITGPEVVWTHLWDRQALGDSRVKAYPYYSEESSYPGSPATGLSINTVVDTLEMDADGGVFGVRTATSSVAMRNQLNFDFIDGMTEDVTTLPVAGQVVWYVEWSEDGVYAPVFLSQACLGGPYFYQRVQAEEGYSSGEKADMLAFLNAYDVPSQPATGPSGVTEATFYDPSRMGVGYTGNERFTFLSGANIMTGFTGEEGAGVFVTQFRRFEEASTRFVITKKTPTGFSFVDYLSGDVPFEDVTTRTNTNGRPLGLDKDGLDDTTGTNQNLRPVRVAYIGNGAFAYVVADLGLNDPLYMRMAVMTFYAGHYTREITGQTDLDGIIDDTGVRTIQEEIPRGEDKDPYPAILSTLDDSGQYISNDGGLNWIPVFADGKYRDLAYVGNKLLARPYNKSELVT